MTRPFRPYAVDEPDPLDLEHPSIARDPISDLT